MGNFPIRRCVVVVMSGTAVEHPRSRADPPLLFGILLLGVLSTACRSTSTTISVSGTDCGTTEESTPPAYSASARECLWTAYSDGKAAYWNVHGVTIEGDPVPAMLSFDPARGLDVTRDLTADKFSNQSSRRVWSWHCATMTKRVWATEASRYSFELSGCTGDGASTIFP